MGKPHDSQGKPKAPGQKLRRSTRQEARVNRIVAAQRELTVPESICVLGLVRLAQTSVPPTRRTFKGTLVVSNGGSSIRVVHDGQLRHIQLPTNSAELIAGAFGALGVTGIPIPLFATIGPIPTDEDPPDGSDIAYKLYRTHAALLVFVVRAPRWWEIAADCRTPEARAAYTRNLVAHILYTLEVLGDGPLRALVAICPPVWDCMARIAVSLLVAGPPHHRAFRTDFAQKVLMAGLTQPGVIGTLWRQEDTAAQRAEAVCAAHRLIRTHLGTIREAEPLIGRANVETTQDTFLRNTLQLDASSGLLVLPMEPFGDADRAAFARVYTQTAV